MFVTFALSAATKFPIGEIIMFTFSVYDKVWVMRNNRPSQLVVYGVVESMNYSKQGTRIRYQLVESQVGAEDHTARDYSDKRVFSTKEELVATL